ncbi:Regulatory protein zeste [Camponotus japonicus]
MAAVHSMNNMRKSCKKKKYKNKEAMFQALAESFQKRGYVNATKNHMKKKFKLLKKKWDNYIKRTMGKNSSGKGMKPLPYEDEMIRIFGKSHSGVPPFVAGRNEIVSQKEILQKVGLNLFENENEEQSSIAQTSSLSILFAANSESESSR